MKTIKVKDDHNYARDPNTGAILLVNKSKYDNYIKQRQVAMKKKEEIDRHGEEINNLKQDISDIKEMLKMILDRK